MSSSSLSTMSRKSLKSSKMGREEFFSKLPPEIILDILSRVSVRSLFTCKCVCKSWLNLFKTPEFIRSHLSHSVPELLIHLSTTEGRANRAQVFEVVEFEDSLEIEPEELHFNTVLQVDIEKNFNGCFLAGTVDGLLLLRNVSTRPKEYYVCNPITREYIKIPQPNGVPIYNVTFTDGFGVSRLSNQYKAVRIWHRHVHKGALSIPMPDVQVYTLGTASWRSISTPLEMVLDYGYSLNVGQLLNGNLHWLAKDLTGTLWVSCFDLETEALTKFRAPEGSFMDIGVLRGRLCVCDNSSYSEITLYMLNDYGDPTKSWSKELVIKRSPDFIDEPIGPVCALKACGDGHIIMSSADFDLSCYVNGTEIIEPANLLCGLVDDGYVGAMPYVPSFISLKDFETESAKLYELECQMI